MVKGNSSDSEYQYDPEYEREQHYHHDLASFEGVEGILYGINDDIENLKKLIDLIGESVVREELDFKRIENEEFDPENPSYSEKVMDVWHKKLYRPFTYRALLMLIQSVFENGVSNFRTLMIEGGRLQTSKPNNGTFESLKEFEIFTKGVVPILPTLRMFNFIRNKVTHANGNFKKIGDKIEFQELVRFVGGRKDLVLKESKKGDYTHTIQVINSSILKDYLKIIHETFHILVDAAYRAPYKESVEAK